MGPLAAAGLMGGMSLFSTWMGRQQAKAQNILISAQRDADRLMNEGQNRIAAAQGNFHRVAQSLNNQRMLKAASEQYNQSSSNIGRMLDNFTRGSLERQLQASEEMGALQAQAAFGGTGGTTQEMIARTAALRVAQSETQIDVAQGLAKYDAHMNRATIMATAQEGLDVSPIMTNINYVLPTRMDVQKPNYLAGLLSTAASNPQLLASIGGTRPTNAGTWNAGFADPGRVASTAGSSWLDKYNTGSAGSKWKL